MNRTPLLPGAIVRQASDPDRLYLVTATSGWGFEVSANVWVPWDKTAGWEVAHATYEGVGEAENPVGGWKAV